jgi:4-amino-4-deoxy-L-arabinose transferase-like glycosyltransferase/peptidoglycan/xylan/chitin deacetylase (PgdA/CDA1 family)
VSAPACQLALKVDVDTHVGLRDGVPALARALERRGLRASFFVACGPDHTGRAIRRLLRPGFLAKTLRTNVPALYGWRTLLYGTLLPGPQIARAFPHHLRALADAGHEVGVHGYDHVYWQDRLAALDAAAVAAELQRGLDVFRDLMGAPALAFAAPGWQCTAASLAAIDAAGLRYHSCTRGVGPYRPTVDGRTFRSAEIPTTWPTLDEAYGRLGADAASLTAIYLDRLRPGLNVHTIHAEVEGLRLLPLFEALLDALRERVTCVRLIDVAERLDIAQLPLCAVIDAPIPGRAGTVATQQVEYVTGETDVGSPHPDPLPGGEGTLKVGRNMSLEGPLSPRERVRVRGSNAASPQLSPAISWLLFAFAAAAIGTLYAYGTHGFPLSEPDEARYAEIAREMLVRDDWVTPHLNFVKYFEKPPLMYWVTALAFRAFGMSEFTARLPAMVSGLATAALSVWLAHRMFGRTAALLTLPIVTLGPLFATLAQTLTLDMGLTCFMTLAMAALWFGWSEHGAQSSEPPAGTQSGSRAPYRVAYVAAAVAVLIKGPVAAVLVAASALPFLALHGGWRAVRPALDWRGFVLGLAVALPWFILVSWRNPEFVRFFVIDQHIARYLWTQEHGEPVWYYVPLIPLVLVPWGLLVLFDPPLLRAVLAPRTWAAPTRFLVIWAGVIVVFFSLSTSKLVTYILPAVPPVAILTARTIELGLAGGRAAGLSRVGWLLLIGGPVMGLCGAILPLVVDNWRMPLVAPYLFAGGAVFAITGWLVRRVVCGGRPYAALAALAVGWLAVLAVAVTGRGLANNYRTLGLAARAAIGPEDRLATYNHFVEGIPFYAERRTIMVNHCGELRFGSEQGDQSAYFWPDDDTLRREWAAPGRLFLIINRSELDALQPALHPPPIVLAQKDKKLLVVNRPP